MLELRAGKNRIFIKAASLMLAQMLLFTGLTYAVENSLNNSLRVPMKFAADSGKNIHNFIIEEMQKQGNRLTNAQFMEVALFHPKSGYYTTQPRIGIGQDFETAASDPLFGIDMARQIAQMWESMDRPKDFKIVEIGAGTGTLAKRILDHMKYRFPAFYDTLQYIIVDISPGLKNQQREILKDYQDKVRQIEGTAFDLSRLNNITGAFISNELPDAFPVHRITVDKEGDFREIYVTWKEGRYQEELGDISDPGIAEYISMVVQEGVELKSGMELPVNLGLFKWQQELSRSLAKGYIITVDYGGKSKDIYSQDKPAVWGGKARRLDMPSIYDYLSRGIAVDITSLVDFGIIAKAGEQRGIDAIDMLTQQAFMSRIENREAYPRQAGFCVLIQSKGIGTNNKLASNATILGYLRQLELDEKKKVSELDGDMTQEWQIWDERDINGNIRGVVGRNI